jgi:hypothetical protein
MMGRMKPPLKLRLAAVLLASVTTLGSFVGHARADDDVTPDDARVDTYTVKTTAFPDGGNGTAKAWLFLMFLGIVGLTGMFKDARRSHLD